MESDIQANILLVDDRPENLLAMETVLADLGQNLVRADSAQEALRFLMSEDVALILLDVQMPGVDGFELAELIRERERTQHAPIIFVTAVHDSQQYIFKGYSLGAVDYLTKPFAPEILRSKARCFVQLFHQSEEIKRQAFLLEASNRLLDGQNMDLEIRVTERTAELESANRELEKEVAVRKQSEAEREELLVREKSLRSKAENASRLKDEFLATVSHELRTPLNSILGWGQILNEGKLSAEDQKMALETIHRNAKSQAQLIDDLLDTSRLITGNLRLELSPTDVVPLIQNALDVLRPAAEAKNISVLTEFTSDVATITCDSHRLQQMVSNLLNNAVKFTPNNGSVTVKFEHGQDSVLIVVTDSGKGIQPEFLPFVFDRFRQADSSSTRINEGVGLGLAIVRHLAELHGGEVSVTSEGLGKGSSFTIALPFTLQQNPKDIETNGEVIRQAAQSNAEQI